MDIEITSEATLPTSQEPSEKSEDTTDQSTLSTILPTEQASEEITTPAAYIDSHENPGESHEVLETSGSSVVFRPLFTYRYQQFRRSHFRSRRSVDGSDGHIRAERSILPADEIRDMDEEESSIVFRPLLRYDRRLIVRRRRAV